MTTSVVASNYSPNAKLDVLQQRKYGKTMREHVYQFGWLWLAVGVLLGAYLAYKGSESAGLMVAVGGLGLWVASRTVPRLVVPLWRGWMALGLYMGMVVTPVILGIVWILVVTPLAVLLRLMGTRVMNLSFRENVSSYWEERKDKHFSPMTRQF